MKAKPATTTRQKSGKAAPKKAKPLTDLEIKGKLANSVRGGATLFSATTSQQKLK
jgi:hypothetical protein